MPLIYDMFGADPHSVIELNDEIIVNMPHVPTMLGDMGIFTIENPMTREVSVASEQDGMVLIPFSADGEPPEQLDPTQKNYKLFKTERLAKGKTVYAKELAGLVNMTGDQQMARIEDRVAKENARIMLQHAATKENMRMGAVRGYLVNHDGSIKEDFFDTWGVARPADIPFDLGNTNSDVRSISRDLERTILAGLQTQWSPGMSIAVLCSSGFFEDLIGHPNVEETYLNQQAANELRGVGAYDSVVLGGNVTYYDYRGGEGGASEIKVPDGKASAFPVGVPDAFMEYEGPADEFKEFLNEPGRDYYSMVITDLQRGAWDQIEGYSYPLMLPTRVGALQTLSAGAT